MRLTFFFSSIFIFCVLPLTAQKKTVGFAPFAYNVEACSKENALTIYNYVLQGFDAAQRFTVLDRLYGTQVVIDEQEVTKDENFMDGKVIVKKGRLEGAEWMVSGHIMAVSTTEEQRKNSDGSTYTVYLPTISFFLRVYDVVTGELVASEVISPAGRLMEDQVKESAKSGGLLGSLFNGGQALPSNANPSIALSQGMTNLVPHIKSFIRENFPFELENFKVKVEYEERKVMAMAPNQMGAEVNQIFHVIYIDSEQFGEETVVAKRNKGDLKVVELAGPVLVLAPKNKKDGYLFDLIESEPDKIILAESSKKAGLTLLPGGDPEKRKRREEAKEKEKQD